MEQAKFAAGRLMDVEIAIDSLLLKRKRQDEGVEKCQWNKQYRMCYTTKLSPSVYRPVSLR